GPAAREAAISLGVLARNKEAIFPAEAYAGLASALQRDDSRVGAAYALSRMPRGEGVSTALAAAIRDRDPWTRSLAARASGEAGLPAESPRDAFQDPARR